MVSKLDSMEYKPELKQSYNEKGEAVSPILMEGVKNFLIDIDGTICDDVPNEEPERMGTVTQPLFRALIEQATPVSPSVSP